MGYMADEIREEWEFVKGLGPRGVAALLGGVALVWALMLAGCL